MSWLLIIDNGADYSDHGHMPIAACRTEEQAIAAKRAWDAWKATFASDDRYDFPDWVKANPPPIGPAANTGDHRWFYCNEDTIGIIEVPDWADR